MNSEEYRRTLFIYAKDGQVKCLSPEEAIRERRSLLRDGWTHTSTIDPARWIEALLSGDATKASDMMDELQITDGDSTTS